MPHSFGYRSRTRHLFQQSFRAKGPVHLSKYLTTYKLGALVDVKVNPSIHRGLPHKVYQGRTGLVWNVTKRAVGVQLNKKVGNRIIQKRIHVRIEHVQPSRCREDHLKRVTKNEEIKAAATKGAAKVPLKRIPGQPKPGKFAHAKRAEIETVVPMRFEILA